METGRFDRLTRLFGGHASRRAGLRTLAAVTLAGLTGGLSRETAAARPSRRGRRLGAEGPCGNGSGKANACRRHRDCCTGICQRMRTGKRKRCRCRRRNQPCTQDRNCCNRVGQNLACLDGTCQRPTCGQGAPCRVFATNGRHPGTLGGVAAGDERCRLAAAAARLPGQYLAWLADDATSPAARFTPSPEPYVLVDAAATRIANNWDDLIDGALLAPINVTEDGGEVPFGGRAWTGTSANGTSEGENCDGWALTSGALFGRYGITFASDDRWAEDGSQGCAGENNLYCFEQVPTA